MTEFAEASGRFHAPPELSRMPENSNIAAVKVSHVIA